MAIGSLEERVTALEKKLAALSEASERRLGVTGRTNPEVLEEMFGVFADSPHAREVLDTIAAERERERREYRDKAA
ncbi:hypothetical protein [Armatimonas rosea]|uniref:Uncharacterized protein n=1 Tax=Armatimonas rosea TaxID=685828 RepID=A0A7W9SQ77_ARMRO|nr:hypothetical protein [Armatimonas rosea]MBB6050827.1 hypothetical protein [Armatimonas rosea]